MAERNTIRWEQDDDGIVVLTLDDPEPVGQHDERRLRASRSRRRSTASRPRRTRSRASSSRRAKKTFFAGGDLNDLKKVTPENADEFARLRARGQGASCAAWRRSASRSSRRSTARRSAAASRSRSPATTASSSTTRRPVVGFPEVQLGLLPGAGGVVRSRAHARHRRRAHAAAAAGPAPQARQGQGARRRRRGRRARVDELVPAAKAWIKANPEAAAAVGRGQELQDPRRHAVEPEARAEPAGLPGQPAQAAQGRELPGAARTSWPPPSRARRSTSTTRSRSRAATSSTSPRARSRRT